jgi:predicted small lipoprotein YifL
MFRTYRHILFLTCTAVLLSGCGLKGALYLPEERAKQRAEAEQQKKARATSTPSSTSGNAPSNTPGSAPGNTSSGTSTAPAAPTDTTHPPSATPPPRN